MDDDERAARKAFYAAYLASEVALREAARLARVPVGVYRRQLMASVSQPSDAALPRDVDSETAFEADMRLSPGLFKRVRE